MKAETASPAIDQHQGEARGSLLADSALHVLRAQRGLRLPFLVEHSLYCDQKWAALDRASSQPWWAATALSVASPSSSPG